MAKEHLGLKCSLNSHYGINVSFNVYMDLSLTHYVINVSFDLYMVSN